jgi:alkaline phosphatase
VGVSVTCPITHATPAGFLAHVLERGQASDIAAQIAAGEADVLFGGGLGDFTEGATPAIRLLREKMKVALTPEEFRKIKTPTKAAALLYPAKPPKAAERTISLKEQTQKALEILAQNPQGFVLLVEGSAIDWAGHENNAEYLIGEAVDFDNAVGAGLDFAAKNGETLVLVTADHETGGFAVLGGSVERRVVDKTGWVLGNHTASIVPLFAAGLGCELFSGFQDNTDIAKKMIALVQKPVEKKTLQNEPSEK